MSQEEFECSIYNIVAKKEALIQEEFEDDDANERNFMRMEALNRHLSEDERIIYGVWD